MKPNLASSYVAALALVALSGGCATTTLSEPVPTEALQVEVTPVAGNTQPFVEWGTELLPGVPYTIRLGTHCGVEWLGQWNDLVWYNPGPTPPEWQQFIGKLEVIDVTAVFEERPVPKIDATANGVTLTYVPTDQPIPGCD